MIIRIATSQDGPSLRNFYAQFSSKYLLPRPDSDFDTAISRGQFFIIEDAQTICAAAGVFDYGDNLPAVELSETCVATNYRGFRMQALLLQIRIASVAVSQGSNVVVTTAIDPRNKISKNNIIKAGFVPWEPIKAVYSSCPTCKNRPCTLKFWRRCCCDYYQLPRHESVRAIRDLINRSNGNNIHLIKQQNMLSIGVAWKLLTDHQRRAALQDIANGGHW